MWERVCQGLPGRATAKRRGSVVDGVAGGVGAFEGGEDLGVEGLFGEAAADHDAILVDGEGEEGGLRRGGEEGDSCVGALEPVDDESGVFGEGFGIEA